MIKILYSILLCSLATAVSAQNFAPTGAKWYYSHCEGIPESYYTYESVKDTVIDGFSLREVKEMRLLGSFGEEDGRFADRGSFYVCSEGDTAYVYNPVVKKLDKLYIFNVQKGDTLTLDVPYYSFPSQPEKDTTFQVVIDSVATEDFGGMQIRKYKSRPLGETRYWSEWYYDYIGDPMQMFPFEGVTIPEHDGPLRCYSDQNLSAKFSEKECDDHRWIIFSGLDEANECNHTIQVFYSPSDKTVRIESVWSEETYTVEILTTEGIKIRSFSEPLYSLKDLTEGIYLIRIRTGNTYIYNSKIQIR